MPVTLAAVRSGLDSQDLKYTEMDSTTIRLVQVGRHAQLIIVARLDEDGEYLSMRTLGYATCPQEHRNFARVMTELTKANYTYAVVSFGWDKSDGEIAGEVSLPLEDNGKLTPTQVSTLYGLLVISCDELFEKLEPLLGHQNRTSLGSSPPGARLASGAKAVSRSILSGFGGRGVASRTLAFGILLIGIAAVASVVWLFVH